MSTPDPSGEMNDLFRDRGARGRTLHARTPAAHQQLNDALRRAAGRPESGLELDPTTPPVVAPVGDMNAAIRRAAGCGPVPTPTSEEN